MPTPRTRARASSKRLPRDERIAKIMSVTRAMLAEKGYDNIVTPDVAMRCGISEATIYKYFDSKRDLLIKVAEQWFEELLKEDHRSVAGRGTLEALRQLVWRSLSVVRREPALTRFVLMDLRPDPDYRNMPVFELNRRFTSQITEVLREGVKSGELRADVPVSLVRDMIYGCIEHQTWAFLRGEGEFSVDEVTEGIATVVFNGMAVKSAAAKTRAPGAAAQELQVSVARLERVAAQLEKLAPAAALPSGRQPRRPSASKPA
jgi:TetR/AcrR family transcriptional regulator, fatty acid metabolism regulator protein